MHDRWAGLLLASCRAASFEQKPYAALGFIDPRFEQACGCDVAMLLTEIMRFAHARHQLLVVSPQQ